jgi:hypothetical protein
MWQRLFEEGLAVRDAVELNPMARSDRHALAGSINRDSRNPSALDDVFEALLPSAEIEERQAIRTAS